MRHGEKGGERLREERDTACMLSMKVVRVYPKSSQHKEKVFLYFFNFASV